MFDIDEQDKAVTHYLVPANVSTKFEIFEGFGWEEAKNVVIALAFGFLLYLVSGLITKTETVNIKDLSPTETIGLKEDANTKINGDIITKKVNIVPMAVRFFFIIIPGGGVYFAVKRDPSTGMSLITNLKAAKEFNKKQKRYLYKYDSGTEI
jgi:hypothetical protein